MSFAQPATITAPLRTIVEALEDARTNRDRLAYVRRLAWKRTALRCLFALIVAGAVLAAFVSGVISRDRL